VLSCLAPNADEAAGFDRPLVFDSGASWPAVPGTAGVILPRQWEARAATLLERGVHCVFVGDATLADPGLIERLASRFGSNRVGVYVPARRRAIHWSLETTSNADFKVVAPSCCEPAWEVLRADRSASGLTVQRWIETTVAAGARSALVQVDIEDGTDLDLCAGLVETLGERLCLTPTRQRDPAIDEWIRFGKARWIALPPALYLRQEASLRPRSVEGA
jgi:hypothetical protein